MQKWMDNTEGAFAHVCSSYKCAVSPDSVDAESKKSAQKRLSITVLWRILKSNADVAITTADKSVAENLRLGEMGSRDYPVLNFKAIRHCHCSVK